MFINARKEIKDVFCKINLLNNIQITGELNKTFKDIEVSLRTAFYVLPSGKRVNVLGGEKTIKGEVDHFEIGSRESTGPIGYENENPDTKERLFVYMTNARIDGKFYNKIKAEIKDD